MTETILLPLVTLESFLAEAGPATDRESRADIWRKAHASMVRLAGVEAGQADSAAILPLPAEMAGQVEAVTRCERISAAFSEVPVAFGLVDVEAVIASRAVLRDDVLQHWTVKARGCVADDPALAALCLPVEWDSAPSLMHAARLDGRLLLLNGHHRARVLGTLGVRYVPCLVSACADLDDVGRLAPWLARDTVAEWFAGPRPPMLRDYSRRSLVHTQPSRAAVNARAS